MPSAELQQALQDIESRAGGRLGLAVLDTGSGRRWLHRADERFLLCSTFKLLLCAQVLDRAARGEERLDRQLAFSRSDLVEWSPVTKKAVGRGRLSVAQLCEATMTTSDNTAALLLLKTQGGPTGLTRWLRTHGDTQTRLDRSEPDLNLADPTGEWDTTTPAAMADTVQRLCLGAGLPKTVQAQLQAWMKASTTGAQRLRAGLPTGWQIGDKTGTGDGISNDVAIVWPPGQAAPWVVVALLSNCRSPREVQQACLAEVGRLLPRWQHL
ncbi:class A beta-lactamase [Ideonella dechloratans]|uniref:class A beta-lactamase n=1 Tax=Ideonella dechloratans TaxID=36863 RepID=UPI0035B110B7